MDLQELETCEGLPCECDRKLDPRASSATGVKLMKDMGRLLERIRVEGEGDGLESTAARPLIADDHGLMREGLRTLLEREPDLKIVGLAEDGLEAVNLAHEVKPDVVLMDINMPRMDGIEATRRITAALPETRVIGLSVHPDPQIAFKMLAAGASYFVPKTASPEELTVAIRTLVGSTRGM